MIALDGFGFTGATGVDGGEPPPATCAGGFDVVTGGEVAGGCVATGLGVEGGCAALAAAVVEGVALAAALAEALAEVDAVAEGAAGVETAEGVAAVALAEAGAAPATDAVEVGDGAVASLLPRPNLRPSAIAATARTAPAIFRTVPPDGPDTGMSTGSLARLVGAGSCVALRFERAPADGVGPVDAVGAAALDVSAGAGAGSADAVGVAVLDVSAGVGAGSADAVGVAVLDVSAEAGAGPAGAGVGVAEAALDESPSSTRRRLSGERRFDAEPGAGAPSPELAAEPATAMTGATATASGVPFEVDEASSPFKAAAGSGVAGADGAAAGSEVAPSEAAPSEEPAPWAPLAVVAGALFAVARVLASVAASAALAPFAARVALAAGAGCGVVAVAAGAGEAAGELIVTGLLSAVLPMPICVFAAAGLAAGRGAPTGATITEAFSLLACG